MSTTKIAFVLWNMFISLSLGLNLNPTIWNLDYKKYMTRRIIIGETLKQHIESKTRLISIAVRLEYSRDWEVFINQHLLEFLKNAKSMKFEIFNHRHERIDLVMPYNLWYVDSYRAFRSLLPQTSKRFADTVGKYVVIMDTAKHLKETREMQLIFDKAFRENIIDIVIAEYVENSTFDWYTYDLFQHHQCRQVKPRRFYSSRDGRLPFREFFPYKLGNFHRCSLDIIIRNVDPYFNYNLTKDHGTVQHYWGMQAPLLRIMADKLNAKLQIQPWNESISNTVYANGTTSGVFKALEEKKIEVVMGHYHYLSRSHYFAQSSPYFMTPVVVVLPKYKVFIIQGRWLLAPFRAGVWLTIILLVASGMLVAFVLHFGLKKRNVTWLDVWGLALGNARTFRFYFIASKYFVIFATFGFMMISGAYQGQLYGAFHRKPKLKPLSVQQLIADNYTFLIKKFVTPDLIRALQIPSRQIERLNYSNDDQAYENMLTSGRPQAMLTNYWQFQAFVKRRQLYEEYDIVPQIVIMNQICIYMQPQSYLLEPFNRVLDNLKSGGLLDKWKREVTGHLGTSNKVEIVQSTMKSNTKLIPLSLLKIRLVFMGFIVMYVISLAVFVGEIIVKIILNKLLV